MSTLAREAFPNPRKHVGDKFEAQVEGNRIIYRMWSRCCSEDCSICEREIKSLGEKKPAGRAE